MNDDNDALAIDDEQAAGAVLTFLQRSGYEPIPQRQLLHRMHVSPERRPLVRRLIRELIRQGRIIKLRAGRLAAAPSRGTTSGVLQRHRDGYGFVVPDAGGEDLFVSSANLGDAMSGDRVTVRVTRQGRAGRREGEIVQTLERRSRRALGVFESRGRGGQVRPFDPGLGDPLSIPGAFCMGASDQQVVSVEILRPADAGRRAEGKVLEIVGHLDDAGIDVLILARKYGLQLEFPDEVLADAENLPSRVGRNEVQRRRRFDDPPPVTIDGETAKDFDDAIAVEELRGGGFRLYVHIADVSHFVAPGSVLDQEACRRGTSVYFPHRVLPMLPEKLSNDLCSLRPGVDRLVQTAMLDLDGDGHTRKVRYADGVIRSAARLTYTQVARVLAGEERVKGVPPRILPMLHRANRLRKLLERRRRRRGSVDFDLPEPRILLDVEGVMTGITIEPRNKAHLLIEECMLAANEAVAADLEQRGRPCMFRVHDPPDPLKIEALAAFVKGFGRKLPGLEGSIAPGDIQLILDGFEGRPEYPVVSQVALRSMKRARYSMENIGHFGLAAETYCHFTSPIRRYPDLVVHRLLREARRGGKPARQRTDLTGVAETCSELERNAEAAERELLVRKKIAFIQDRIGEGFTGVVTGVAPFGLFVQLTENLVEGLIRVSQLGPERFDFVESRLELRGTRSATRYRLGDRLEVRVDRVDRVLQRVDFSLADKPAKGDGEAGARRADRRGAGASMGGGSVR